MELHTGAIVERVVRRSGVSITELARRTHINRRSVYNWFNQKKLKLGIICKIGRVLGHDFSIEFPNFFPKDEFSQMERLMESKESADSSENVYYWMNKYIMLLEKYNDLLIKASYKNLKDDKVEELAIEEPDAYSVNQLKVYNRI